MPKTKTKTLRCPTCGALVLTGSEGSPFCSDRCRRIDLGKWASGAYIVSSPVHDPDLLDELDGLRGRQTSGDGALNKSGEEE